jgi:hypothetical protein
MIARSPPPDSVKDECGFVGLRLLSRAALASPASFLRCAASRRGASIASNLTASRAAIRARALNGFEIRTS